MLRAIGSLWFANVLLVLLLVALGYATVYESMHGAERALAEFYGSAWFATLLALFAVSVLAAMLLRFPFKRSQVGFVLTHASLLVIILGAVLTRFFAVDGQLALADGQSSRFFRVPSQTLTLVKRSTDEQATLDMDGSGVGGFHALDDPGVSTMDLSGLQLRVSEYLPDTVVTESVADGVAGGRPAVQLSLSTTGRDEPTWVFDGQTVDVGPTSVAFRTVSEDAWDALVSAHADANGASKGRVKTEIDGETFEFPIEDCTDSASALGDTGMSVRVLRYLPHAVVGAEGAVENASPLPRNPVIEVELIGPEGRERRLAFARFPDFQSMHEGKKLEGVRLTFVPPTAPAPAAPVELFAASDDWRSPDSGLLVRFSWEGTSPTLREIAVGTPVSTPWPNQELQVLRRFNRAVRRHTVGPAPDIRRDRVPAVRVEARVGDETVSRWVRRRQPETLSLGGAAYDLTYGDRVVPLGFEMKLEQFRIGYYPGTQRPRSFESHVSITDAATGRAQSRVISMNRPTNFGGYMFCQSSYRLGPERNITFLGVSRDPGRAVAFVGFVGTFAGMMIVLWTRTRDRRRTEHAHAAEGAAVGSADNKHAAESSGGRSRVEPARQEPPRRPSAGKASPNRGVPERQHT